MEKLILDVVVNEGKNNYPGAKEDAQKNKIQDFTKMETIPRSWLYYISNKKSNKINLKGRKFS